MPSLIALVLEWLFPARGRHRPRTPVSAPAPAQRHAPKHFTPLDGGALEMVRPYLIAWERQEARRTALLWEATGIDFAAVSA